MAPKVSVQVTENPVYDGSTGAQIDTEKQYQLGATIDGVFVPFVTKAGSYIDHKVKQTKERQPAGDGNGDGDGDGGDGNGS